MYFRLPKDIYAAKYEKNIILLDAPKDKYFSITDSMAQALELALAHQFTLQNGAYTVANISNQPEQDIYPVDPKKLSDYIITFIQHGFLEQCNEPDTTKSLRQPVKSGGLSNYQWDFKSSWTPFAQTNKLLILKALWYLFKAHKLKKKHGIHGMLSAVTHKKEAGEKYIIPDQKELQAVSDAVDVACALFFKKIYCLEWATTFVLLALDRGYACNLHIGVQAVPFYAHAWATCNGTIINDDPIVQEYLAQVLETPFAQTDHITT